MKIEKKIILLRANRQYCSFMADHTFSGQAIVFSKILVTQAILRPTKQANYCATVSFDNV